MCSTRSIFFARDCSTKFSTIVKFFFKFSTCQNSTCQNSTFQNYATPVGRRRSLHIKVAGCIINNGHFSKLPGDSFRIAVLLSCSTTCITSAPWTRKMPGRSPCSKVAESRGMATTDHSPRRFFAPAASRPIDHNIIRIPATPHAVLQQLFSDSQVRV